MCALVGSVLHTMADGEESIKGVSLLDNLLFVLRDKSSEQIEVYDKDSSCLQRCFTVDRLCRLADIVVCAHYRCCYISNYGGNFVHRLALADARVTQWQVNDDPWYVSVTGRHSVLVTYSRFHSVQEYTTDGQLIRQLQLPPDVTHPWYAIQLFSGEFIVCCGGSFDPLHGVCLISSDGQLVKSYGGPKGSGSQQMDVPIYLAVDRNGFVFVADRNNFRVLLLSPSLTYIRDIVTPDQLHGEPERLCLDAGESRLYVAVNKSKRRQIVVVRV